MPSVTTSVASEPTPRITRITPAPLIAGAADASSVSVGGRVRVGRVPVVGCTPPCGGWFGFSVGLGSFGVSVGFGTSVGATASHSMSRSTVRPAVSTATYPSSSLSSAMRAWARSVCDPGSSEADASKPPATSPSGFTKAKSGGVPLFPLPPWTALPLPSIWR